MKEKNVKAEAYSRRSNIRFDGIPTSENETNVQCRNKIYDLLKNELGLPDDFQMVLQMPKRTLLLRDVIETPNTPIKTHPQ